MDFFGKAQAIETLKEQFLTEHPQWMVLAVQKDPALYRYIEGGTPADKKELTSLLAGLTLEQLHVEGLRAELMNYPGLTAIATHGKAKALYEEAKATKDDLKFAEAREWAEVAHTLSGVDMHPGANVSPMTFIDHGTGDVIGETARIGEGTIIFQGVTLGGYGKAAEGRPRHPTIGRNVEISTGAKVYGDCEIEDGVKINPDAVIIQCHVGAGAVIDSGVRLRGFDVPPNTRVTGEGARILLTPIEGVTTAEKAASKWFSHTRVLKPDAVRELYDAAKAKGEESKGLTY